MSDRTIQDISIRWDLNGFTITITADLHGRAAVRFVDQCYEIFTAYTQGIEIGDEDEIDFGSGISTDATSSPAEVEMTVPRAFLVEKDPRAFRRALEEAARHALAEGEVIERRDDALIEKWLDAFRSYGRGN